MYDKIHASLDHSPISFTPEFYLVMINNSRTIQGNPQRPLLSRLSAFQVFLS